MIKTTIYTVEVFDEDYRVSLEELQQKLGVETEFIEALLNFGLIEPVIENDENIFFDSLAIQRIHTANRLRKDLNINMEGIALALELLEELHELREKIKVLERLI